VAFNFGGKLANASFLTSFFGVKHVIKLANASLMTYAEREGLEAAWKKSVKNQFLLAEHTN
jgi:hypothetical protein